ncbi:hypothetical protein BT93_K1933 [Corymbia citriodora subsp. variegata]|nr:hypothetical protein BT93_K1933 [Corymbia citriodora subsp. variegata]
MYMWEACDFYPEYKIDILMNKSFIKVVGHDRIRMQDPLRNFGREIVRQENFGTRGDRSRLWLALDIIQAKKVASNLKALKIAGSKSLIKTPRFPELVHLNRLVLKDFLSLSEIDCTIGQLEQLTYLKIKWCPHLKELPKEIGCLTALRELILIQGFCVHYLPDTIGNITHLSRLVMEDTGVVKLPDTIKGLVDLQYLCLANCTGLDSLPDAVGELRSLTELDLSGTTIEELPQSLCDLKDLKLRINKSSIRARRMGDLLRLDDIEDCSYSGRRLEPDGTQFGDLMRAAFQIFDPVYGERKKPTEDPQINDDNFLSEVAEVLVNGIVHWGSVSPTLLLPIQNSPWLDFLC